MCDSYGAFLTFKAARKLNVAKAAKALSVLTKIEEEHEEELVATVPNGSGYTVSVRCDAECLRSKHVILCDPGPPKEMFSAAPPFDSLNRTSDGGFQCRTTKEFKRVGGPAKRIGMVGLHDESDFQPDIDEIIDPVKDNFSIVLGRYGPFLKQDRKTQYLYNVKNMVFSCAPADYACEYFFA